MSTSCLLESSSGRKNKISLTDYDYQKDIANRLLLAKFSSEDLLVLEEILYSSLRIPITDLADSLDMAPSDLLPILQSLLPTGLFTIEGSYLSVDKEKRKYFETQMARTEEDFRPDMEFLQDLLKKIPIHILPIWYSIPRTSNNIFESIIEKHLLTPQLFQRYILEANFGEPVLKKIIDDVYTSPSLEIPAKELMKKYQITEELFEEYMLHLEFSFICCLKYKKTAEGLQEIVTPFHEWKEYATFLRKTEAPSLKEEHVTKTHSSDFSFVEDLSLLLQEIQKTPLSVTQTSEGLLPSKKISSLSHLTKDTSYIQHLIAKLLLVRLVQNSPNGLQITPAGIEWLSYPSDQKSFFLYRHPLNKLLSYSIQNPSYTERSLREAEKSILRVLSKEWVLFEDFLRGCHIALKEEDAVTLKRSGKGWKYALPSYTEEERSLLYAVIFEWLLEAAIVQTGLYDGKPCFKVTPFGQILFAR
jgi:hypothetical protein